MKQRSLIFTMVFLCVILFSAEAAFSSGCEEDKSSASYVGTWTMTETWYTYDVTITLTLTSDTWQITVSNTYYEYVYEATIRGSMTVSGNTMNVTVDGFKYYTNEGGSTSDTGWIEEGDYYWDNIYDYLEENLYVYDSLSFTATYTVSGNTLTMVIEEETYTFTKTS